MDFCSCFSDDENGDDLSNEWSKESLKVLTHFVPHLRPSTERRGIREDGRSGHWAVVKGRGPKISQEVFASHGCGLSQFTATKFFCFVRPLA